MVVFLEIFSLQGYTQVVSVEDAPVSISIYVYMLKKARRNLFLFHPPKLGDPTHTRGLIAPLYHPLLLLRSLSLQVRSCGLQIAAQFYYCNTMKCLESSRGGDGSLPSPVFGFI